MKLFEEFKLYETMWDDTSCREAAVVSKETDQLCSVLLDGRQMFTGTKKECEDWVKSNGDRFADRLTIKDSATVNVVESTVTSKETDQLCSVLFDDQQVFTGTKEECEDWIKSKGSKFANRLTIKDSATVNIVTESGYKGAECEKKDIKEDASLTESDDPYGYRPYKNFSDPDLKVGDYVLTTRPFNRSGRTYPARITSISSKWIEYEISGFGFTDRGTKARPGSASDSAIRKAATYLGPNQESIAEAQAAKYEILYSDRHTEIVDEDTMNQLVDELESFTRDDVSQIHRIYSNGKLGKTIWTEEEGLL